MHILIVEDEDIISEGIFEYLTERNYACIVAKDGQEAIDKFEEKKVDLVLLDIMLPKLNGLEVLKQIRKKSKIPVLMLTSFNDDTYKITAFSSLCDRIYRKTFLSSSIRSKNYGSFKKILWRL